jgi:hypothetical protein
VTLTQADDLPEFEFGLRGLHGPFGPEAAKYRVCLPTVFATDEHKTALGMAQARDGSGFLAALFTRPEFGCVQFEPLIAPAPTDAR